MDESAKLERLSIIARTSPIAAQALAAHETCTSYAPLERQADVDECLCDALEATAASLAQMRHVVQGLPFMPADRPIALATPGKSCKTEDRSDNPPTLKDLAWQFVGHVYGCLGDVLGDDCELTRERNAITFSRPSTGQVYSVDLATFAAPCMHARQWATQIGRVLTASRPPR